MPLIVWIWGKARWSGRHNLHDGPPVGDPIRCRRQEATGSFNPWASSSHGTGGSLLAHVVPARVTHIPRVLFPARFPLILRPFLPVGIVTSSSCFLYRFCSNYPLGRWAFVGFYVLVVYCKIWIVVVLNPSWFSKFNQKN